MWLPSSQMSWTSDDTHVQCDPCTGNGEDQYHGKSMHCTCDFTIHYSRLLGKKECYYCAWVVTSLEIIALNASGKFS